MPTPTRRHLLTACVATTLGAVAGCASYGRVDDPESDEKSLPDDPESGPPSSEMYVSAVVATQESTDDLRPDQVTVLIETTQDGPTDLSGSALAFCGREVYAFPDLLSDIQPGAALQIYTGNGENGVDASAPPEYTLFVGSDTELLANDGMTIAIRSPDDDLLDAVTYPSLAPGERYDRPQ